MTPRTDPPVIEGCEINPCPEGWEWWDHRTRRWVRGPRTSHTICRPLPPEPIPLESGQRRQDPTDERIAATTYTLIVQCADEPDEWWVTYGNKSTAYRYKVSELMAWNVVT